MCRAKDEGGRRCPGFSNTAAAVRIRKRLSRARRAIEQFDALGDDFEATDTEMDAYLKATDQVLRATMALERARADHDLVCSGKPLSAEDRYRILMNEQRDHRRTSQAQDIALQDYVANSGRFNFCLRDPKLLAADDRTRAQIADIRRVLKRSTITEGITVYRVVPADAPAADRAFLSTTLDPQFALRYQKQFGGRPTRILKIDVAAGSRALYINNTFEREVLLFGDDHHPVEVWDEQLRTPAASAS
jgi:hypothetical protein